MDVEFQSIMIATKAARHAENPWRSIGRWALQCLLCNPVWGTICGFSYLVLGLNDCFLFCKDSFFDGKFPVILGGYPHGNTQQRASAGNLEGGCVLWRVG